MVMHSIALRSVQRLAAALVACIGIALPGFALAQAGYPNHPIMVVVPFPPGGGGDTLARTVLPKVGEILGQPIVIENKPGAGGNIGAEFVSRATPDGYTLLYGTNGTHGINKPLYKKLPFDPEKSFAPISRLTQIPALLVVHPSLPVDNVQQLIAYLKANPGKVNFASAGNGTTSHLSGELFKDAAKVDIVHVPYRGGGPAMTDLLAGRTPMMIDVLPNLSAQVAAGKLKPLAVTTATRVASLPNVPTLAESGLPGFNVSAWDAVFAPAGTPKPIVDRLNAAIRQALDDPKVKEALAARGAQPYPSTPEELGEFVHNEAPKWAKAVTQSGATVD
jgi:tripartite-type tricarboxylate transporter receptor subunit TctC